MTFNFETFSTNMKATFYTTEKYGGGGSERDKVITFLENIRTTNKRLESGIKLCRYNHTGNYLAETNHLIKKIIFVFLEQQPSQQKKRCLKKRNVSHVKDDNSVNTKSFNVVDISDMARLISSEE